MKDEIPPLLIEAHAKVLSKTIDFNSAGFQNIEAHAKANNGKIDPNIGLEQSGIAGDETQVNILFILIINSVFFVERRRRQGEKR